MSDIRLYLGCGPLPIHPQHLAHVDETWTLVDLYVDDPKIVKMDIRKLEYPDNSVSSIYCSHTLEHIGMKEIAPTFAEWLRVLKPGGDLVINVPDMEWVAQQILDVAQNKPAQSPLFNTHLMLMEVIYGNQDHEGEFHKSGFTEISLLHRLIDAGFKNINVKHVYEAHLMGCLLARAEKGQ